MTNYKALGIDKDMDAEIKKYPETELQRLMSSSYFDHPYITKRVSGTAYCMVKVISCKNDGWWYKNLLDLDFFCKIRFTKYSGERFISEFVGVRLSNSKEIIFRSFDPEDVVII